MRFKATPAFLPMLALIAATGFWGSSFFTVSQTLGSTDPFTLVFMRFGIGAALVALWLRRGIFRIPRQTWRMGAVCALVIYSSYLLNHMGLMTILSSTSGFLTALYVPLTPLLFWLIGGKRPDGCAFLGAAVAFIGLTLLANPFELELSSNWGEWVTVASAFLSAAEIILMGRYAPKCKAAEIAFAQIVFVALFALVGTTVAHCAAPGLGIELTPTVLTEELVIGVLWLAVILTCAQLLLAWGQKYVPPAQAAVIFALESVFAALIGWCAGERLGVMGLIGGGCIVLGIFITEFRRMQGGRA